jgi:hypothetical protein
MTTKNGNSFYDSMTAEEKSAFESSIKAVYGKNATYNASNGKVTYTDADGNV